MPLLDPRQVLPAATQEVREMVRRKGDDHPAWRNACKAGQWGVLAVLANPAGHLLAQAAPQTSDAVAVAAPLGGSVCLALALIHGLLALWRS